MWIDFDTNIHAYRDRYSYGCNYRYGLGINIQKGRTIDTYINEEIEVDANIDMDIDIDVDVDSLD